MEKREIGSRAADCYVFCVYTERDMSRRFPVSPAASFLEKRG
jgi:hypothetical protein